MTEAEAREWLAARFGADALERLEPLVGAILAEAERQNLIARSTLATIWSRHVVDSAQLLLLAEARTGRWIDIGTGAGFPGLVVAVLRPEETWLVEPRRQRAAFLERVVVDLGLRNVRVCASTVEQVTGTAAILSARAVAALSNLLAIARHCASADTLWLLPKGRSARSEVETARRSWHGVFHVEQSLTDPAAEIVVARQVRPR